MFFSVRRSQIDWLVKVCKFRLARLFVLVLISSNALAEDAIVTMYNHGSTWKSGLPGTNHNFFSGCLYDGDVRLNCFRDHKVFSHPQMNRFVVFHLPAGQHVFSASYGKHPPGRSQLQVLLEPGKHYYLRAQSESRGFVEVEWEYGRMENRPCADATVEMQNAKPLPEKLLTPDGKAAAVTGQPVPPCL